MGRGISEKLNGPSLRVRRGPGDGTPPDGRGDLEALRQRLQALWDDPLALDRLRRDLAEEQPTLALNAVGDEALLELAAQGVERGELATDLPAEASGVSLPAGDDDAPPPPAPPKVEAPPPDAKSSAGGKSNAGPPKKRKKKKELPAYLVVYVKDDKGEPVKGADVAVDGSNFGVSDASGKVVVGQVSAGSYTIEADKSGYYDEAMIVQQVDAGTSVQAVVKLGAFQIVKVEPSSGTVTDPTRWYINLSRDVSKQQGRYVVFEAHVSPARAGVKICFALESHTDNYDKGKLYPAQQAKLETTSAQTDGKGVAKARAVISVMGGDRFRVAACFAGQDAHWDGRRSGFVQVWRRLYYQQTYMKKRLKFGLSDVLGEYERQFVELKETRAAKKGSYKENMETAELEPYGKKNFKSKKSPMECHIVLINRQWDKRLTTIAEVQIQKVQVYKVGADFWPYDNMLLAQWRDGRKGSWTGAGVSAKKTTKDGDAAIEVDLTLADPDFMSDEIWIYVRVYTIKGRYLGDGSSPPHVFIATGDMDTNAGRSQVTVHEIGHLIGLVPKQKGYKYQYSDENGGNGSHCRYGATPDMLSLDQGGIFAGTYENGKCTMFAYGHQRYEYCPVCGELVRKTLMCASDMKRLGWG